MLLSITILLVFFSAACTNSANALKPNNNNIIVEIINNANFDICHIQINVYKNGDLLSNQGSMYADHSKVKKGVSLSFEFTEQDFNLGGEATLEFVIVDKDNNNEIPIDSKTLRLTRNKEYTFELSGDSITSPILNRIK